MEKQQEDKNLLKELDRSDIYVAGVFDLDFPEHHKRKPNQITRYKNYIVAPKRPMKRVETIKKFGDSILAGDQNVRRKLPTLRYGKLELGGLIRVTPLDGEEVLFEELIVYPNRHIAWVMGEYNKALERKMVSFSWYNKFQSLSHSIPYEKIENNATALGFATELYEGEFFNLLKPSG